MSRTVSSEQPAEVIRRRLHAENTIRDLERKLDATEQRNTKHYVAQKMLEQEVQCSKDLLESVKSRLSTSEAALNQCHCKDEQSALPQTTAQNDLYIRRSC